MRKCAYCGHVFRGVRQRCPECAEILPTSVNYLAGFSRIQLAIRLSDLGRDDTSLLEKETLGHLRQDMSIVSVAEIIEARHNGRYTRFCTILRNLGAIGW